MGGREAPADFLYFVFYILCFRVRVRSSPRWRARASEVAVVAGHCPCRWAASFVSFVSSCSNLGCLIMASRSSRRVRPAAAVPAHSAPTDSPLAPRAEDSAQAREDALLWTAYRINPSDAHRNMLVTRYSALVRVIAEKLAARLPASVTGDDLFSAGIFGLIAAIKGFDPTKGVKFETYCTTRIRGAMLDEMRHLDWAPRQVRSIQSRMADALADLEAKLGRTPTDEEVQEFLNLNDNDYQSFARKAVHTSITSLNQGSDDDDDGSSRLDVTTPSAGQSPLEQLATHELWPTVTSQLDRNERIILTLYFHENMTMKDIGRVLGISESRVCQINSKLSERLKSVLVRRMGDPLTN